MSHLSRWQNTELGTQQVYLVDLNRDGKLDIVAGNPIRIIANDTVCVPANDRNGDGVPDNCGRVKSIDAAAVQELKANILDNRISNDW